MKKIRNSVLVYAFSMALIAWSMTACGPSTESSTTDQMSEVEETAQAAQVAIQEEVNEVKTELQLVQSNLKGEIQKLDDKIAAADEEARMELMEAKTKLQMEGEKLEEQLRLLESDVSQGWDKMKADAKQLTKNIENSIRALSVES